jgi:hypothetical protein
MAVSLRREKIARQCGSERASRTPPQGRQAALRRGRHAAAREKLEDVSGTGEKDINLAMRPDPADLEPGLKFDDALPTSATGPEPRVAILLGPAAFDAADKAATLGVLRHEMEHAFHDRLPANWPKRWREDTGASKPAFAAWLTKQSMSPADLALVKERIPGSDINTEALAQRVQRRPRTSGSPPTRPCRRSS